MIIITSANLTADGRSFRRGDAVTLPAGQERAIVALGHAVPAPKTKPKPKRAPKPRQE